MSGGVDSSVAAAVLRDEGHEVVGCTLRLWGGESDSGCCSAADVDDARRVAQVLDVDHHVFNLADEFDKHVVDPYVTSHGRGETPNPCVECNRSIKFGALLARASRLGFETVATGHHARITSSHGGFQLRRGRDVAKDQSYVLGFLTAATLARVVLPIGTMTKLEVRTRAGALGLRTAAKPDSQEVCFIPRGRRDGFLASRTTLTPGNVLDRTSGALLGTVPAIELVTVGQRRASGTVLTGSPGSCRRRRGDANRARRSPRRRARQRARRGPRLGHLGALAVRRWGRGPRADLGPRRSLAGDAPDLRDHETRVRAPRAARRTRPAGGALRPG